VGSASIKRSYSHRALGLLDLNPVSPSRGLRWEVALLSHNRHGSRISRAAHASKCSRSQPQMNCHVSVAVPRTQQSRRIVSTTASEASVFFELRSTVVVYLAYAQRAQRLRHKLPRGILCCVAIDRASARTNAFANTW
jgi:hypothetical protein